jgi:pSer/pThr/pTyr-binding forkhead associated (FHA) protein
MGGSAAEVPASPDEQPAAGLRASDAERDQVVDRLRDEFVAGRLSHDTFLHRMNVVLHTKRQADLPPVLADLPPKPPPAGLVGWLRGTWYRVTGGTPESSHEGRQEHPTGPRALPARILKMTTTMHSSPDARQPLQLRFPRGGGDQFSIGRDAGCDLAIADMTVSRRHAQLDRTPDGWMLSDLVSTNGTRVNGWRVRGQVPVKVGDLVSFGNVEIVFSRADEP